MFKLLELLSERPIIKVIDVGAMALDDETATYQALVKAGMAKVVGFEPVQAECDKLNAAANKNQVFLPYAIGDGQPRLFHVCNYPMTSSLYEPNTALVEKFQNLADLMRVVRTEELVTHRLDDLAEAAEPDYLKLDVQGAELDVLQGAESALAGTLVVHTEVEFVPLYKGQPLFAEVDQHLRRAGFLFHRFAGLAGRAFKPLVYGGDINRPLSQILWADAVYVKDFNALDRLSDQKLLKLAIILHLVYGSFDLAHEVLRISDTRTQAGLAARYLAGVLTPAV